MKVDKSKEDSCLNVLKAFLEHKNFDKAIDDIASLTGSSKDKIMKVISSSCVPCES